MKPVPPRIRTFSGFDLANTGPSTIAASAAPPEILIASRRVKVIGPPAGAFRWVFLPRPARRRDVPNAFPFRLGAFQHFAHDCAHSASARHNLSCSPASEDIMATIRKEIRLLEVSPERAWDALRDVGALHTRLVPGFVTDTRMEGSTRVVTFGNGAVAREEIVSIDEKQRRVCWAIVGAQFRHFNGAAHVFDDQAEGAHFVWTTDLLPDELAAQVETMMSAAIEVIKKTLER
jgi:hypothetical protein